MNWRRQQISARMTHKLITARFGWTVIVKYWFYCFVSCFSFVCFVFVFFFTSDLLAVSHVFCVPFKHTRVTLHFNMYNQKRKAPWRWYIAAETRYTCAVKQNWHNVVERYRNKPENVMHSGRGSLYSVLFFSPLYSWLTPLELHLSCRNSCPSSFQLWAHTVCRIWMIVCIIIILGTIIAVMWCW